RRTKGNAAFTLSVTTKRRKKRRLPKSKKLRDLQPSRPNTTVNTQRKRVRSRRRRNSNRLVRNFPLPNSRKNSARTKRLKQKDRRYRTSGRRLISLEIFLRSNRSSQFVIPL